MKSPGRSLTLEIGLFLSILLAPAFFGAVHSWASMSLCAFLFFLLFLYPESFFRFRSLPRFFGAGILVLFGLVLVQFFITSHSRPATAYELLKWLALAAAFLAIQLLSPSSLHRLMKALVCLGILESLYGLFEVWTGHERVLWQVKESHLGFVTGTYFNRNHLAGLLELCLGVHLGFVLTAFERRNFKLGLGLVFCLLITLTGFFQTGSRMGIASFIFSFLGMGLAFSKRLGKTSRLLLFSSLLAGGIAFWAGRQTFLLRLEDLVEGLQNWDGGRLLVWRNALGILRDHPWFGGGLGSFEWIFPSYQSESLLMGWPHAHNDYLELAVELGIPGFAVLVLSFASLGLGCFSKTLRVDSSFFPLLWGCLVSLTAFALHGLSDFNFAIPANAFIFILLTAMVVRLLRISEAAPRGRDA